MADENAETIPAGFPDTIDPGKSYRVQLLKAVPFAGTMLSPGEAQLMTGEQLSEFLGGQHKDSIYGAQEA